MTTKAYNRIADKARKLVSKYTIAAAATKSETMRDDFMADAQAWRAVMHFVEERAANALKTPKP